MSKVDTDNSGYIDYNEYIAATTSKQKMFSRRNLEQAFKLFDQDGNGKISSKEIMQILGDDHVTLNICKDIIREVDSDGNGIIDLAEFKEMLAKI
jgi:Ca2+-binding EF-hand superfamily protein